MVYPEECAPDPDLTALGDCGRDVYRHPRAGDMFRFGSLWVIVEKVSHAEIAALRLIDPLLGGTRTVSVSVPLPGTLVPVRESAVTTTGLTR